MARVEVTNKHLNKWKSAAKNTTGTTLILAKKNLQDKELSKVFFLRARQRAKTENASAKDMSTCIKLSEPQLSRIVQSDGLLVKTLVIMMSKLGKKAWLGLAVSLAKNLFSYIRNQSSFVCNRKIWKKNNWNRSCKN